MAAGLLLLWFGLYEWLAGCSPSVWYFVDY